MAPALVPGVQTPVINYQALLASALKHAEDSGLFQDSLSPAITSHITDAACASNSLPVAGSLKQMANCARAVDAAVPVGLPHGGGLALLLSSLIAEGSHKCAQGCAPDAVPQPVHARTAVVTGTNTLSRIDNVDAQVEYLLIELQEPHEQFALLQAILERRGADAVWALLLETNARLERDDPICRISNPLADGRTHRTPGGIFLKLEGQSAADARSAKALAAAPAPLQLREYQLSCVETIMAPGNFIVAAPTGSGKTAIFVEAARRLLQANSAAKVLVIVPTVPLTTQQYTQFVRSGDDFGKCWAMEHFSGDKPLAPADFAPAFMDVTTGEAGRGGGI